MSKKLFCENDLDCIQQVGWKYKCENNKCDYQGGGFCYTTTDSCEVSYECTDDDVSKKNFLNFIGELEVLFEGSQPSQPSAPTCSVTWENYDKWDFISNIGIATPADGISVDNCPYFSQDNSLQEPREEESDERLEQNLKHEEYGISRCLRKPAAACFKDIDCAFYYDPDSENYNFDARLSCIGGFCAGKPGEGSIGILSSDDRLNIGFSEKVFKLIDTMKSSGTTTFGSNIQLPTLRANPPILDEEDPVDGESSGNEQTSTYRDVLHCYLGRMSPSSVEDAEEVADVSVDNCFVRNPNQLENDQTQKIIRNREILGRACSDSSWIIPFEDSSITWGDLRIGKTLSDLIREQLTNYDSVTFRYLREIAIQRIIIHRESSDRERDLFLPSIDLLEDVMEQAFNSIADYLLVPFETVGLPEIEVPSDFQDKKIFSSDQVRCCQGLKERANKKEECCSLHIVEGECFLPNHADVNLYLNKYVSSDSVKGEIFSPDNQVGDGGGHNIFGFKKISYEQAKELCASGNARLGESFISDQEVEIPLTNGLEGGITSIMVRIPDIEQMNPIYRWPTHYYCSED